MTTKCTRHNNVMQFFDVSKNCQVTGLEFSTFWKKRYSNFTLNVFFFIKELKGPILSQNHRRSQGGGPGDPGFLNQNATNDKSLTKMPCFFILRFF